MSSFRVCPKVAARIGYENAYKDYSDDDLRKLLAQMEEVSQMISCYLAYSYRYTISGQETDWQKKFTEENRTAIDIDCVGIREYLIQRGMMKIAHGETKEWEELSSEYEWFEPTGESDK